MDKSKLNLTITQYEMMLQTKENLVKPYHIKQNLMVTLFENDYKNMLILESEISLIKEFIEDLKFLQE